MMSTARTTRPRGFTLIEVLISTLIMAMIAVLLAESLRSALNTPDQVLPVQQRYNAIHNAMERMARELASAYLSMHYTETYEYSPHTMFKLTDSSTDDRLDFTAFAHQKLYANVNESDQCELSYFLEEDKEERGLKNLMRREAVRIDEQPDKGGYVYVLLDGVKGLNFSVYDSFMSEWKDEWDSWRVEQKDRLPRYVRIDLTITNEFGEDITFTTKTEIMLKEAINLRAQAPGAQAANQMQQQAQQVQQQQQRQESLLRNNDQTGNQ